MENILQVQIQAILDASNEDLGGLTTDEILAELPPAAHNLNQVNSIEAMVSEVMKTLVIFLIFRGYL